MTAAGPAAPASVGAPAPGPDSGWTNSLAFRLFVLIWAALVVSHVAAFAVVHGVMQAGIGGHAAAPIDRVPRDGVPSLPPAPSDRPPLPTFPSLPPTPGLDPPEFEPGGLPMPLLMIDYGVRLLVIAAAGWWGSRWLARPMTRLVSASQTLGPALARGQSPPLLDEHQGTREVRAAATVFNAMASQIRQLFQARGLMIAAISHDLRTPLTRMRLRVETASIDGALRERCVADLQEMNGLIDTVLEVFRPVDPTAHLRRIDVAALAQAVVDDRTELGEPVEMSGDSAVALIDPADLRRVLGNLIDNALRYAGAAEVSVQRDGGTVRVAVRDRGPGIPASQLDAVLQPFVRLETSRHRGTGGVGLGLFIASQLTQRMGARLVLGPRTGGGLSAEILLETA